MWLTTYTKVFSVFGSGLEDLSKETLNCPNLSCSGLVMAKSSTPNKCFAVSVSRRLRAPIRESVTVAECQFYGSYI